jgi:CheY-like chemotaxis protein
MIGLTTDQTLPTLLVIDDDLVSREVMATMLTLGGFPVHTAKNGAESLAILDGGTCAPEVILMDTQMPGLSGIELIEQLRIRSKAILFAISASEPPADVLSGVDGFLMKPFGSEELHLALEHQVPAPEPLPLPDVPVINLTTLAQLRGLMPESGVREIFAAVATDLKSRHELLEAAIARGDSVEVRRIGHAIKGGCSMAGAMQAARMGELLETRGDDLEYSRSVLPHLQAAAVNLKRMLDAELSTPG